MKKKIKKGIVAGVTASVVGVVCTTAVLISDKEAKVAAREQQKQEQIYVEKESDNDVQETFAENNKENNEDRNISDKDSIEKEQISKEQEEKENLVKEAEETRLEKERLAKEEEEKERVKKEKAKKEEEEKENAKKEELAKKEKEKEKEESTKLNSKSGTKLSLKNNASVYSEASSSSSKIGSVNEGERVVELSKSGNFVKIRYSGIGGSKTGYVTADNLKVATTIPSDFNNISVASNVSKVKYGTSGQGRSLYYYKIGSGKKTLLLNYAIHGYEDAWAQDGYELSKMANATIKNLAKRDSAKGLNDWSVYIISSSNPDAIVNGYTNDGPGRTQMSAGIDVNRDFPTNFKQNSTARNKTGASALTSPEARALAKLTKNLKSKSENMVVVDVHGWLNTAYGDQKVSKYFANQYGFSTQGLNRNNGGYYAAYAESLGADVSLVELPKPSSPASIEAMNYSGKMINAVNNLIDNYKF